MSQSEPTLTRTYCTLVARRALLERVQWGLLIISAHTPLCIRHGLTPFTRLRRTGDIGTWQGETVFSSDRVRSSDPPSCIPVSSRRQGASTQGNSSQIVTQAQTVPAFERGDYGKRCCTRFRTTISMQYPWVEKDPSGYRAEGRGIDGMWVVPRGLRTRPLR